jgi:hypothetical protein
MYWSQDLVTYILFPYLLPSLSIHEQDCWPEDEFKAVLEYFLISFCNIGSEKTQNVLETFVRRTFLIPNSSCYTADLNDDLSFLANIQNRDSFKKIGKWKTGAHYLYASSFLIENKAVYSQDTLTLAIWNNYKEVVALLLKSKANVHIDNDDTIRRASKFGDRDIAAVLIEHKANIHAENDEAFIWASIYGHSDVVALLLLNKANVHVNNDEAIMHASKLGYKSIVVLLLAYNANVNSPDNCALRSAIRYGHRDIVDLLLEHKAEII